MKDKYKTAIALIPMLFILGRRSIFTKRFLIGICIVFALYFSLRFAVDLLAPEIPISWEKKWGELVSKEYSKDGERFKKTTALLQERIDKLTANIPNKELDFTVHFVNEDVVNAGALPGGHIVIYDGLLRFIDSEEELGCVLGHEVGHILHRDHLRGMGHNVLDWIIVAALYFLDIDVPNEVYSLVDELEVFANKQYSREQESQADLIGLELNVAAFGHAGGCTDFHEKLVRYGEDPDDLFENLLSTHPTSKKRIADLEKVIEDRKYEVRKRKRLNML